MISKWIKNGPKLDSIWTQNGLTIDPSDRPNQDFFSSAEPNRTELKPPKPNRNRTELTK